ncbi:MULTISPECIES: TetR/AcrR family transcriptional regulator [Caulobacter]|uniref:AcrR family transcriptional regulator n=1 Tax=Caulobacter rhizosphaerae TaxID=2010972 RepID=A0ABU1N276_9CAUL|nr:MULTISPECIES: TetR/AcrR family transcriptional regulator [Caulobacter]MDR6532566.1 AcrR family transcriptional regulator [Caulobacter rhizosphaerae]
MRADARKNRERLIEVAVELVLEVGGEPARDAVAARAGVGIGTLYRHFPDRQSLLHAAVRHVLERSISAGEDLVETVPDGVDALRRYMHVALDNGIGAVNIIHPLLERRDWPDLHARAVKLMQTLVSGAVRDGPLRSDFSERDIVFALIRFARPLAVGLPPGEERALAHRHLDFYIDGLCVRQPRATA